MLCFLLPHLTWLCSHVRSIPAPHRDVEGTGSLLLPHLLCLGVFWALELSALFFIFFSFL